MILARICLAAIVLWGALIETANIAGRWHSRSESAPDDTEETE